MDEHFDLNGAFGAQKAQLVKARLAVADHTRKSHVAQRHSIRRIVPRKLSACVYLKLGDVFFYKARKTRVRNDKRRRTVLVQLCRKTKR